MNSPTFKYRIVKHTTYAEEVYFRVQYRNMKFWRWIDGWTTFDDTYWNMEAAQKRICDEIANNQLEVKKKEVVYKTK